MLLSVVWLVSACGGDGMATTQPPPGTATAMTPVAALPVEPVPTTARSDDGAVVASTAAIPTDELPVVRFFTAGGVAVDLPVEVPPRSEYHIGLSGRRSLEGRGMLFYYAGESGGPGFWMRGTYVDLDIAFVAGDGSIIVIKQMRAETEEVHHPGWPYLAGIEAPIGWYEAHGIAAGGRVEFLFDPEALLAGG